MNIRKYCFVVLSVVMLSFYGCKTSTDDNSGITGAAVCDIVVVPGASVTTNGWADMANSGSGMSYPSTTNIIVINDTTYTTATAKRTAFTNAIASGSVSSNSTTTTAAIIILSGTVDLSDGVISDSDHTYFDSFDVRTHARRYCVSDWQQQNNNRRKFCKGGIRRTAGKVNIIYDRSEYYYPQY